jgi:hypothetical protein
MAVSRSIGMALPDSTHLMLILVGNPLSLIVSTRWRIASSVRQGGRHVSRRSSGRPGELRHARLCGDQALGSSEVDAALPEHVAWF